VLENRFGKASCAVELKTFVAPISVRAVSDENWETQITNAFTKMHNNAQIQFIGMHTWYQDIHVTTGVFMNTCNDFLLSSFLKEPYTLQLASTKNHTVHRGKNQRTRKARRTNTRQKISDRENEDEWSTVHKVLLSEFLDECKLLQWEGDKWSKLREVHYFWWGALQDHWLKAAKVMEQAGVWKWRLSPNFMKRWLLKRRRWEGEGLR